MKAPKDISQKIRESMDSLEGIERAQPNPFFFTRLEAKLEDHVLGRNTPFAFLANMKLNFAVLMVALIVNIFSYFLLNNGQSQPSEINGIEALSSDYFTPSDNYSYLNSY